ncbi:hypothetical protein H0W26_04590 [Candidatus Dependentiae bacterium]|nr:hypothetical protein [Candidatus Dependentiae bacterium]
MNVFTPRTLYGLAIGGALCGGFLFYALYNDYIIIRLPSRGGIMIYEHPPVKRKNATFFYWHQGKLAFEEKMILSSTDMVFALTELVTHWLATVEQEGASVRRVNLDTVLLDRSGTEAFISFDRSPFIASQSTFQKLMWIEGLLKTLNEAGLSVHKVRFLMKSKPLVDPHLDFNHSYPLTGYDILPHQ